MSKIKTGLTRRGILGATVALPMLTILSRRGDAAEFAYKYATGQDPTHPVNIRAQQAIDKIREATNGRVDMKLFPANQLGSDTDLLAQVRSGGVEFFNLSTSILATLVPVAGILNTGFAFPDYDHVWKAMDGGLGAYVAEQITKAGLIAPAKMWDNGFRQITSSTREIRTPKDLDGFKIRVPPAPMLTSVFKMLGAGATPINFNELYSALQTKVVEGQENPLAIIASTRLNEGVNQRADIAVLSQSLRADLTSKGMSFIDVNRDLFRDALAKTTFYADWHGKYGEQAWDLLEAASGKLG